MHRPCSESLPPAFCWTRFGPEAGEPIEQILARKEAERTAGRGIFYWGIGNAVGPAMTALLADVGEPEVLFSPIASPPRRVDVAPCSTVQWLAGEDMAGECVDLPDSARVTSGWEPTRPNAARYALVCSCSEPIELADRGQLRFGRLRNISSGSPVGASQVTTRLRAYISGRAACQACLAVSPAPSCSCPTRALRTGQAHPAAALAARDLGALVPAQPSGTVR
jgi:hypothetical protein